MKHIFVWTLGDVITLVFVGAVILLGSLAWLIDKYQKWKWRGKK